ncbi:2'-5' RNA ligase family protein [Pedobacter sp. SYP-B3415]|uniref:2'-5' RNA ligase family protein n=1 Tax=Pedobacter sp. SYP-B3415 TaxID=2496641 RepID=UPI0013ECD09D|nr:2'-5' RNA ligase family protein [Pedobacter sp. SYP-B3415]
MESMYLIAILPPPDISARVHLIRQECAEAFGTLASLRPPVHMTLAAPLRMDSSREQNLVTNLERACNQSPFNVELENFGGFENVAVFIDVKKTAALTRLRKEIVSNLPVKAPSGPFHPHFTIAYRDIAEVYPLIMGRFKRRKFFASFVSSGFTLLKHDGRAWQRFHEFSFLAGPKQLSLESLFA